ncbi:MAG: DUF4835 family protein [Balneolales bacterium]|nr:DUF4835 family protein [Balneolales bacterium]
MKFIHVLLFLLTLSVAESASAQEIRARVTLNSSQIQNASIDYLDDLIPLIEGYINNHNWTEHTFEENERIGMNIQIALLSENNNTFEANLVITVERPIYNTLQLTPLILLNDGAWRFTYNRNQSITHDAFQFNDIASMFDYYVYLVLGLDFDTFSELGGTPFYRQAQNVLEIAQSSGAYGWTTGSGTRRNRHFLVNGLLSSSHEPFRKALYRYHRHGLDIFTRAPERARENIFGALELIQESRRQTTDDYVFELFFGTKSREITSVFIDAEAAQRLDAYILLTNLDSGRISEYDRLQ